MASCVTEQVENREVRACLVISNDYKGNLFSRVT